MVDRIMPTPGGVYGDPRHDRNDLDPEEDDDDASEYAWLRSALQDEPSAVPVTAPPPHTPHNSAPNERRFQLRTCRRCGCDLTGRPDTFIFQLRPGTISCASCRTVHLVIPRILGRSLVFTLFLAIFLVIIAGVQFAAVSTLESVETPSPASPSTSPSPSSPLSPSSPPPISSPQQRESEVVWLAAESALLGARIFLLCAIVALIRVTQLALVLVTAPTPNQSWDE